jgi:hypothetical protein
MSQEQQAPEFVTFDDKQYKIADLSQDSINLINRVLRVEQDIAAKSYELDNLAAAKEYYNSALREKLADETPVEVAEEAGE